MKEKTTMLSLSFTQVKVGPSDPVGRVKIPVPHGYRIRSVTFRQIPMTLTVFL
jgi:hypothetical protein